MSVEQAEGIRGRWKYVEGELVPFDTQSTVIAAPFIRKDEVDAFENPVTGEMETSMSTYRRKLKEAGYFEKGNDRMKYTLPSRDERYAEIREATLEAERQIKWGMAKSTTDEREIWDKETRDLQRAQR